jgi:hypothetical protein
MKEMEYLEYRDYLIEKPLCLIYWSLETPYDVIENYFSENFEIKKIKSFEDLMYWCKMSPVKVVVLGVKDLKETKEISDFINEKIPISKRREVFLIYVLPKAKTLDPKETFLLSANLVVSEEHLSDFERIYQKAFNYWSQLYKDFKFTYERLKEEI